MAHEKKGQILLAIGIIALLGGLFLALDSHRVFASSSFCHMKTAGFAVGYSLVALGTLSIVLGVGTLCKDRTYQENLDAFEAHAPRTFDDKAWDQGAASNILGKVNNLKKEVEKSLRFHHHLNTGQLEESVLFKLVQTFSQLWEASEVKDPTSPDTPPQTCKKKIKGLREYLKLPKARLKQQVCPKLAELLKLYWADAPPEALDTTKPGMTFLIEKTWG